MFRAAKLDLGCFVNIRVIRDHTKRKVYEQFETQRYVHACAQRRVRIRSPVSLSMPLGSLDHLASLDTPRLSRLG